MGEGHSLLRSGALLLVVLAFPTEVEGQPARPRIRALRSAESISVDGRLDEPAWASGETATGFWQREPFDRDGRILGEGIKAWDVDRGAPACSNPPAIDGIRT